MWKKHLRLISTPHVLISLHDWHGWSLFLLWLFLLLLELLKQLTSKVLLTNFSRCKFFVDIFSSGFYHMFCIQVCHQWCALKEFFAGSRRPFLCLMGRCFACTGTKLSWNPTSWLQLEWRFSLLFYLTLSLPTSVFSPSSFFWQKFGKLFGIFVAGNITSTVLGICKISTSQNWEEERETLLLPTSWLDLLVATGNCEWYSSSRKCDRDSGHKCFV